MGFLFVDDVGRGDCVLAVSFFLWSEREGEIVKGFSYTPLDKCRLPSEGVWLGQCNIPMYSLFGERSGAVGYLIYYLLFRVCYRCAAVTGPLLTVSL